MAAASHTTLNSGGVLGKPYVKRPRDVPEMAPLDLRLQKKPLVRCQGAEQDGGCLLVVTVRMLTVNYGGGVAVCAEEVEESGKGRRATLNARRPRLTPAGRAPTRF